MGQEYIFTRKDVSGDSKADILRVSEKQKTLRSGQLNGRHLTRHSPGKRFFERKKSMGDGRNLSIRILFSPCFLFILLPRLSLKNKTAHLARIVILAALIAYILPTFIPPTPSFNHRPFLVYSSPPPNLPIFSIFTFTLSCFVLLAAFQ